MHVGIQQAGFSVNVPERVRACWLCVTATRTSQKETQWETSERGKTTNGDKNRECVSDHKVKIYPPITCVSYHDI